MAQQSSIEWTDFTWNPVAGCRKVSTGCTHCYAERMARRLAAIARALHAKGRSAGRTANYLRVVNNAGSWNGKIYLDHEALTDPLSWKLPRTIFVNSMSDLFHEDVPLDFIKKVFDVMNNCPQHRFQILTKRPHIAAQLSKFLRWTENIWMGTSIENAEYVSRAVDLRRTKAKIKFLSIEPLLGPIPRLPVRNIDWVIVGGESGPGARPLEPEWVRCIRDRCLNNGVAFFFKQWGGTNKKAAGRSLDNNTWNQMPPK